MESIGARFHQTRESRGFTLEQVARDTHIARRFLEALENEDFSIFPGEPYLIGFMRTYSSYLGLDSEETISLYHNLKLQEQPPPIDELIARRPALPVGRVLLIIIVVLGIGAVGYLMATSGLFSGDRPVAVAVAEPEPSDGVLFSMIDEIVEQRFGEGDRILVPIGGQQFAVDILLIDEAITLGASGREQRIRVGEEILLDVNNDMQSDLRVIVRSVDRSASPRSAVMRLDRGAAAAAAGRPVIQEPIGVAVHAPAIGSTREPTREESVRLIAAYETRREFDVNVQFDGFTMLRHEVDGQPRVERYYQPGETIQLSVRERIKLWVSNAASVRLTVAGQAVSLGEPGEVTAGLITWVPDPDANRELLELIPVY